MKQIIISLVFVGLLIGGAVMLNKKTDGNSEFTQTKTTTKTVPKPSNPTPSPVVLKGETVTIIGRSHVNVGDNHVAYNSNPPTSGPHSEALPWGFNEEEISDENAVHNLEHGGIWISYKNLDEESVDVLREIARDNSQSIIVSPRTANDSTVAVVSWGQILKLDNVDKEEINAFIKNNINNSPEKFAR